VERKGMSNGEERDEQRVKERGKRLAIMGR
jgi:hypothetical protein